MRRNFWLTVVPVCRICVALITDLRFLSTKGNPQNFSVWQVLRLQNLIKELKVPFTEQTAEGPRKVNVTLSDVCFKPLAPLNNNCAIESATQWFQNSEANLNLTFSFTFAYFISKRIDWSEHVYHCSRYCCQKKGTVRGQRMVVFHRMRLR